MGFGYMIGTMTLAEIHVATGMSQSVLYRSIKAHNFGSSI